MEIYAKSRSDTQVFNDRFRGQTMKNQEISKLLRSLIEQRLTNNLKLGSEGDLSAENYVHQVRGIRNSYSKASKELYTPVTDLTKSKT